MAFDRLILELDEEGWAAFRLAEQPPDEHARGEFLLPKGFTRNDVREAARATGWVIERDGSLWIARETSCEVLARFVCEMIFYFDAPGEPSRRLTKIKESVDRCLGGAGQSAAPISPWVCAWLDLIIREDAKEDIATAEDVWRGEKFEIDLTRHCERRLREVLERVESQPEATATPKETGRMAPSERARRVTPQRRRNVG